MWIGATGLINPVWMDGTETQAGFNHWYTFPAVGNRPRASMRKIWDFRWHLIFDSYEKPYICEALKDMSAIN